MAIRKWLDRSQPLAGAPGARSIDVGPNDWRQVALDVAASDGRLHALWTEGADRTAAQAVYAGDDFLLLVTLPLARDEATYPGLSDIFQTASRMQRAAADLTGVRAQDTDARPWLRHAAWPADYRPLAAGEPVAAGEPRADDYAFVRVSGDGVHEIPVGPVHAGIIEPGHFRFSVVGEKVLRLEGRLGYTHKGIDKRFEAFTVADGCRLAARVCGDSTVAFSWAYAQAAESLLAVVPPPRALWLRALMLERERVANHLGDLGALGNDAALGFALSQFMRLKEDWLRLNDRIFGHRFMMDRIVPGGVDAALGASHAEALARQCHEIGGEVESMRRLYEDHAGLQDRFITTGRVEPQLAKMLGLAGLAGRASGQAWDLRIDHPCEPYGELEVRKVVYAAGDVAARVHARFDEVLESLRLVHAILARMPGGETRVELPGATPGAMGVGWVEGWRGEAFVALEAGEDERLRRGHARDPSWQAWPLIEHAVMGNIVPDFPLINKSFNLSYSGHDS